jgi:hypothetical protein
LSRFATVKLLSAAVFFVILLAVVLFYASRPAKLTPPDEQAQKIIEIFRQARLTASKQGEIMRVEIDLEDNLLRLIDENQPLSADDDRTLATAALLPPDEVRIDARPQNIAMTPVEIMPVPVAQFRRSKYPASASHDVFTFRFAPNGTIFNEGTDLVGTKATSVGLTLFLWTPKFTNSGEAENARAVTVIGGTGSIRFWEYNHELEAANKWQDSPRLSIHDGQNGSAEGKSQN